MTIGTDTDWDPGAYRRFRGLRLRPALDLLARVHTDLPPGDVVDLGCGSGAAGAALAVRFADRTRIGVDASPAMLAEAAAEGHYDHTARSDIAEWYPDRAPAVIFSNAALNWVPDHPAMLPHLAGLLVPGGVLAVQVPDQQDAPSHRLIREVSAELFPHRFDWRDWAPEVLAPGRIMAVLAGLGDLDLWQTTYHQVLPGAGDAHPVRRFTESTVARPVLAELDTPERRAFLAAYDAALDAAYPRATDGTVHFPFTRLFFVLTRRA